MAADLAGLARVADYRAGDPASGLRWAEWQRGVIASPSPSLVVRGANRVGKTQVLAARFVHTIRGTNPWCPRPWRGPLNALFIGEDITQMMRAGGPVETLWSMLPRDEIDPGIYFARGKGIVGSKTPVIPLVSGPGEGTVIMIGTYNQDPQTYAGFKGHLIWADEPLPELTYSELSPRLMDYGGWMQVGFTPVMNMPRQTYMRDLVTAGQFEEHHVVLTPRNTWPEGYARPRYTQEDIDRLVAKWPRIQVALRRDAVWEAVVENRYLSAFDGEQHVKPFVIGGRGPHDVPPGAKLYVGVDHGLKPGKQAACLVAVVGGTSQAPRVWWVAEANDEGHSSSRDDARAILRMLAEAGVHPAHVDGWIGDRSTPDGRYLKGKTNKDLRLHLQAEAKLAGTPLPDDMWIETPSKFEGSVYAGADEMNAAFSEGRGLVHERCTGLKEAFQTWKGGKTEPSKDRFDGARYPFELGTGLAAQRRELRTEGVRIRT